MNNPDQLIIRLKTYFMKTENYFFESTREIAIIEKNVERVRFILQLAVDSIKNFNGYFKSVQEIADLLDSHRKADPEKVRRLVFERIYPETPTGLSRDSFYEIAELPDIEPILQVLARLQEYQAGPMFRDVVYWHVYAIENFEVKIIPTVYESLLQPYRATATTKEQKERLAAVQELCKCLEHVSSLSVNMNPEQLTTVELTIYDPETGKFNPAPGYVLHGSLNGPDLVFARQVPELKSELPTQPKTVQSGEGDGDSVATAKAFAESRNKK